MEMQPLPGFVRPTLRESLTKMLDNLASGRLAPIGGCSYRLDSEDEHKGKPCIVGSLFTEAQIDDLAARGMTSSSISGVAHNYRGVGGPNVEFVLGMTVKQAQAIQSRYDDATNAHKLRGELESILAAGRGWIDHEMFILDA